MKKLALLFLMVPAVFIGCTDKEPVVTIDNSSALEDKVYTFDTIPAWSDEFDYTGKPTNSKWGYDVGGGGWGNNELQYYTDAANADVANGVLTITARKEKIENREYTSARMISKGTGDFLYGRVEAKVKIPKGRGTWPAFWMLPTDWEYGGWPKSGEIDIFEHVGYKPGEIHFSTHTEANNFLTGTQKTATKVVSDFDTQFHTYRMDWTPTTITGYIDGNQYFSFTNPNKGYSTWPFNKRFHILFNIAVGGNWGGVQGIDQSIFPAQMVVDYIRVYNLKK